MQVVDLRLVVLEEEVVEALVEEAAEGVTEAVDDLCSNCISSQCTVFVRYFRLFKKMSMRR
jgi:hypothetical protein